MRIVSQSEPLNICAGMEKSMINFDDEIKKFQPSLEVEEAEDAIYNNDFPDVTDIINKIINNLSDK